MNSISVNTFLSFRLDVDIRTVRLVQTMNREAPGDTPCPKKSILATSPTPSTSKSAQPQYGLDDQPNQQKKKSIQVPSTSKSAQPQHSLDDQPNQQKKKSIPGSSTSKSAQPPDGLDDQPNHRKKRSIPASSTSKSAQPPDGPDDQPNHRKKRSIPAPSTNKSAQPPDGPDDQPNHWKKKSIPAPSTSESAKTPDGLDDEPNQQKKKSIPTPSTSIQPQNRPRFMFRIGSLEKSASRPVPRPTPPPSSPRLDDDRRIAQFVQLGSMIPYADRQSMSARSYPSFDEILERKRRHSSSSSTKRRKEPFPDAKKLKVSNEEEDQAVSVENFPQLTMSMSHIAGRTSPSPTDYQPSQEQDQFPINNGACLENQPRMVDESDEDHMPNEETFMAAEDFTENVHDNENEEEEEEPSVIPASHDVFAEDDEEQTVANKENESEQATNGYQSDEDIFMSTPEKAQMTSRRRRILLTPKQNQIEMSKERCKSIFIACSGLMANEKDEVKNFVNMFGLKGAKDMKVDATHLVVKKDEEEIPAMTLKVFQAVARKLWIVGLSWVKDSVSSGTLVDPEPYEVVCRLGKQGPKRSRLSIGSPKLFEGFEFFFDGVFSGMKKEDLVYLVTTCGAQTSRSTHSFSLRKNCLIVCENADSLAMIAQADRTYRLLKIPTVTSEWIRDSLTAYAIQPIKGYVIHVVPEKEMEKFDAYEKK